MGEQRVPGSLVAATAKTSDGMYPMYFGVSCAFVALNVLSRPQHDDGKWSELCHKMLHGSAQLLGLLVWRIQKEGANDERGQLLRKLETAEKEIEELKHLRREDARANEKVVGIFASQEQSWFIERKRLRQQIGALMHKLRTMKKNKEEDIMDANAKLKEVELASQFKDEVLEEEQHKRKELEEKLAKAEKVVEELREAAKREAKEYSTNIWKHKTAFLELVLNQQQLEAEMSRAMRQLESKKHELESAIEQKEESVSLAQKLSMEVVNMRNDLDQKDNILSTMLRKSKQDTSEKQMLLKEVKLSKSKTKQAELEKERWRPVSDSGHARHSLRSMFAHHHATSRSENSFNGRGVMHTGKSRSHADPILEYENPDFSSDSQALSPYPDFHMVDRNDEPGEQVDSSPRSEAEEYATALLKRHQLEIEAFAEQMRLKDKKLKAFRWRMLSLEIESKRLKSHVEALTREVSQLRHENMKLEALLLDRQGVLDELNKEFPRQSELQSLQTSNVSSNLQDPALIRDQIESKVKLAGRKSVDRIDVATMMTIPRELYVTKEEEEEASYDPSMRNNLVALSPDSEFKEKEELPGHCSPQEDYTHVGAPDPSANFMPPSPIAQLSEANKSMWKMDLLALGVSYKIKRVKQQLLMLHRLTGSQESIDDSRNIDDERKEMKGYLLLMSMLSKHISRYESLQEKTDALCKRMHVDDADSSRGESSSMRTKEDSKGLEHFLDETFQLQRFMVATGQKLAEVQSKIASGFVGFGQELETLASSDMKRFSDNVRSLLQEIQRGLEVRIARIIGDLEGTLACEGMTRMRQRLQDS